MSSRVKLPWRLITLKGVVPSSQVRPVSSTHPFIPIHKVGLDGHEMLARPKSWTHQTPGRPDTWKWEPAVTFRREGGLCWLVNTC